MKIVLTILLALLIIGCGEIQPKPKAYPQWYKNRELRSAVKYEMIGYGEGKTIKEAQSSAKENIAQTLISKVDSSVSINKTTNINNSQNNYNQTSKSKLIVTSKLNLQNLKTIKQEQKDETFFVALLYRNLDLAYRIKEKIGNVNCDKQHIGSYLLKTPLISKLYSSLGCTLDFNLDRKNAAWYLKYKEYPFLLTDNEFEELYVTATNSNFEFKSNKSVLHDGDTFYFTFNSKEDGYITLLDVYESGIVTLLQPSLPIRKTLQIPSKESANNFEAGVIKKGEDTFDLYVAIFTKEPLDMSRFEYADEELSANEMAYKFDELMAIMNMYEYSSLLLRTRAK